MFKKRTLFIVGAGASAEVGLPIGTELAERISTKLDIRFDEFGEIQVGTGDIDILDQLRRPYGNELNEYFRACHLIRDGVRLSNSIDDFLDVHSKNERVKRVGKTAIVKTVLEAERSSKLYYDTSNIYNKMNMSRIEDTWFVKFVRMLGRGVPLERVESVFDNVAFVIFNYDRCVEHFLFNALRQLYAINDQQAADLLSKLCIVHPYGVIADLPFQNRSGVAFGGGDRRLSAPYLTLSERIRTYSEQIEDSGELEEIRKQVSAADSIVFLGFAFYDQNLRLLKPTSLLKRKNILGTAFGMSGSDISVIQAQLSGFFDLATRPFIEASITLGANYKCNDLFDHFTKSLPA